MKLTRIQITEMLANSELRFDLNKIMNPDVLMSILAENGYTVDKNGAVDAPGACNECIAGQNGELDRPFGQGHICCSVVSVIIRRQIANGNLFTRFNNNRWEVITS